MRPHCKHLRLAVVTRGRHRSTDIHDEVLQTLLQRCTVQLLQALRNASLTRRLCAEHRPFHHPATRTTRRPPPTRLPDMWTWYAMNRNPAQEKASMICRCTLSASCEREAMPLFKKVKKKQTRLPQRHRTQAPVSYTSDVNSFLYPSSISPLPPRKKLWRKPHVDIFASCDRYGRASV